MSDKQFLEITVLDDIERHQFLFLQKKVSDFDWNAAPDVVDVVLCHIIIHKGAIDCIYGGGSGVYI